MRWSKYGATKTVMDGITFHSKGEAIRYSELKNLERAGKIQSLSLQPKFPIVVNDIKICNYIADFKYTLDGVEIVEDFKGMVTPIYKLKKKLVKACYGIDILEVFK